ncbi:MAG: RIP metalloprotease RseP, partial [Pseudomonadota bacterium]
MLDIVYSVIAFIVALGVLITFHEYGHYWVARRCGVKVLRFSVGFGKPLWRKVAGDDQTEYVLGAIPLGGYVKMLDEREAEVDPSEVHRTFNRKTVGQRFAIVAAGPIANFLLAIATYWLMFIVGITGIVPIVGTVPEDSVAAQAGFIEEDRIVAIDRHPVDSWSEVRFALLDSSLGSNGEHVEFEVVDRHGLRQVRLIEEDFSHLLKEDGDLVAHLGLTYWWPEIEPLIAGVQPDSPADQGGLREGDRILSLDGEAVTSWYTLVNLIRERPAQPIELLVDRNGREIPLKILTGERELGGERSGFIGAWEAQSEEARESMRAVTRYGWI